MFIYLLYTLAGVHESSDGSGGEADGKLRVLLHPVLKNGRCREKRTYAPPNKETRRKAESCRKFEFIAHLVGISFAISSKKHFQQLHIVHCCCSFTMFSFCGGDFKTRWELVPESNNKLGALCTVYICQ